MDHESVLLETLHALVRRRHGEDRAIHATSDFFDELELDSLDAAELSAILEESFGTDPYTEGLAPRNVGEVLGFYSQPAS